MFIASTERLHSALNVLTICTTLTVYLANNCEWFDSIKGSHSFTNCIRGEKCGDNTSSTYAAIFVCCNSQKLVLSFDSGTTFSFKNKKN